MAHFGPFPHRLEGAIFKFIRVCIYSVYVSVYMYSYDIAQFRYQMYAVGFNSIYFFVTKIAN